MLKVVLIDDEYYFRTRLRSSIPWEENGFVVAGDANNGQTAYQLMLQLRPDVAIVDINMPIYNGIELITMLQEQGLRCRYVILSGYDDFGFAQQAIRLGVSEYILKPVKTELLLEAMAKLRQEIEDESSAAERYTLLEQQHMDFLRESFFRDLVNCSLPIHFEAIYDKRLLPHRILEYGGYQVAAYALESPAPREARAACQVLSPALTGLGTSFAVFVDNKGRICIIGEAVDRDAFLRLAHSAAALLNRGPGRVRCGVGRVYDRIHSVHLSYSEACIALQHSPAESPAVACFSDGGSKDGALGQDTLLRLHKSIAEGDAAMVSRLLGDIYGQLERESVAYDLVVLRTLELFDALTAALSDGIPKPFSVLNLDACILDVLGQKKTISALGDWMRSICQLGMRKAREDRNEYCDVTLRVQRFIEENYADSGLSLTMISQRLFLNYSYICYCFKRDKKSTINEYITALRIEKAKKLFAAQHCNVAYVAEQVGYDNPGYFSKCFKKAVGLPPSEYIRTLCDN